MKRFSPKQVVLIKALFDFSEDSICSVSRDRSSIQAFVGNYHFYFHVCDGCIYNAIYKYADNLETGELLFRKYFDDFYSLFQSLLGFLLNHNCNI